MQKFCILLAFLFAAGIYADDDFPTFPDQFQTQIEVTILNKQYTTRRAEYYDYPNNRFRFDIWDDHEQRVEIFDFDKLARYEIINYETCSVRFDNNTFIASSSMSGNMHLNTAESLFHFGPQFGFVKQPDTESIRGIPCDSWKAEIHDNFTLSNGTIIKFDYELTYYFSIPEWDIFEGNREHRVPIRATAVGQRTFGDDEPYAFDHIYEFVFWKVGPMNDFLFSFAKDYFLCGSLEEKSFPTLPNDFEAGIEVTDLITRTTTTIYEYYDYTNNRFRFDVYGDNETMIQIFDVQNEIQYRTIGYRECQVSHFNASWFGNDRHLMNTSSLWQFGPGYGEEYQGVRTVRGIECDMWSRRVNETIEDGSRTEFLIKYYFSVEDWYMRGDHASRVPVRMEIKGKIINQGGGNTTGDNDNDEIDIDMIYEMVHWVAHTPPSRVFELPVRLFCSSSTFNVSLPDLPSSYSSTIEFTSINRNRTGLIREYYDYDNDRIRIDIDYLGKSYINILLNSNNLSFTIHDGWNCSSQLYTNRSNFFMNDENGHLKDVSTFLHFGKQYNEVYQGIRIARGIPCDVWGAQVYNDTTMISPSQSPSQNHYSDYIIEFYFARENWRLSYEPIGTSRSYRIPIQAVVYGTSYYGNGLSHNFEHVYSFVEFIPTIPHNEVFNIRPYWKCDHVYSNLLTLQLNVKFNQFDENLFRNSLSSSVNTIPANILLLHISRNEQDTSTNVLVDIRTISKQHSDQISSILKSKFDTSSLDVGYTIVSHNNINPDTLKMDCPSNQLPDNDDDDRNDDDDGSSGVPVGGAVGLFFFGLVIGSIISIIIFYAVLKKRMEERFSQNQYQLRDGQ